MEIKQYIKENESRFLEELFSLIRIPSISALPQHKDDMLACAERWRKLLLEAGADDVVENEDENTVVVQCAPTQLHAMKEAFAKEKLEGKMGLAYLPTVRFRAFGAYL